MQRDFASGTLLLSQRKFVATILERFSDHGHAHWEAPLQVQGVCDAAFSCHIDDRDRGYVFMMAFMMGLDVEASKAFDLTALPCDSQSRRRGSPPP